METSDSNCIVSVANTLDNGWETAICISPTSKGDLWLIKKGRFDEEISKASTLGAAIKILFSLNAEWSEYSIKEELFNLPYQGFNSVESIIWDHLNLKYQIKQWENGIDSLADQIELKETDMDEIELELRDISDQMMSINI